MKRYRLPLNLLTLLGLIIVNLLAHTYNFTRMETTLINLFLLLFYLAYRQAVTSRENRLSKLNKDHDRLRLIYDSEHRDTEILHVLDEISASFITDKNLNSVFERTLDGIQKVLKTDISLLEILTEKGSIPTTKLVRGTKELKLNENIYMKVVVQGSSTLINNLNSFHSEYRKYKSLYDQGLKSFLIAPLKITKEPIGLLGVFSKSSYDFTGEELRLLTTFATHSSLIIENARLLETTQRLSITDELTQLYNFRHFQDRFKREFYRARRYNHSLSLLMCDIDYFKNYNDTNGHDAGNEILKKVARIMAGSVREDDFVARWGGEEFVLLLIETNKENACLFAERLRQRIEKEDFPYQEKQPNGNLTISIGVSGFPEDAASSEDLKAHADEALYRAKNAGRNKVAGY